MSRWLSSPPPACDPCFRFEKPTILLLGDLFFVEPALEAMVPVVGGVCAFAERFDFTAAPQTDPSAAGVSEPPRARPLQTSPGAIIHLLPDLYSTSPQPDMEIAARDLAALLLVALNLPACEIREKGRTIHITRKQFIQPQKETTQ